MFTELREAIADGKNAKAFDEASNEILDVTEAEEEMVECAAAHESKKLGGIEFAVLFLEDGDSGAGTSDSGDMELELDDAGGEDDELLTGEDVTDEALDAEGEVDLKPKADDEAELTDPEVDDTSDEMMEGDDSFEGIDVDDLAEI